MGALTTKIADKKFHRVGTAGNDLTVGGNIETGCTKNTQIVNQTASNDTIIHTQNINLSASASSGSLPPKKLKTCCKNLQQKLRKIYKNLFLSQITWLERPREFLIQDYFIDLKLIDSDKPIKIEEIFNEVNEDEKPSRIYIEGQPGYGKTTFANKLVNDWAMQKDYIKHFKLVFLLPLREQKGRSIQEIITSICSEENQNAIDIVNDHKNETLFVIDGLDEVSEEERSLILKTLYGLEYSEVTVIVFSRTSLFSLTKNERKDLSKGANRSSDFHDRNISILGIDTNEKKKKFMKNFLPTHDVDKILDSLKPNLGLFNSPLFLMLLTIIVSEKKTNIGPFSNRTEIYKMLFNFITRHHFTKEGKDIESEFDLFDLNSEMNDTQIIIQQFGKLSLEKIAKNELQFESNNLTKQIYDAGFLINHKQITHFTIQNYYEAFHLSFLEFASAYALWIDLKLNKSNLENHILHFFTEHTTSLVLVFLASLMQNDMDKFISQIKPFSPYFSSNFNITLTLFEDCTSFNWIEKSNIINLLPSVIDLTPHNQSSNICKHLITHGNKYGKIKYIIINKETNPELIPNKISPNSQIIFSCEHPHWLSFIFTAIKPNNIPFAQIRYTRRHCNANEMVRQLMKLDSLSLREQLNYVALSNTESCILYANTVDNPQILEMILNIEFKKIKFECLSVANLDDNQLQIITKLIKYDQVENLKLTNYNRNGKLMNELCDAAGQTTYLTSITVKDSDIDLYHLTNGGTKYHFIHFENCTLSGSISLEQKNCCHHLKFTYFNNFEKVDKIIEMEPKSLTCNSDLLGYLFRKYPNWNGFNSVKHLCLCQGSFKMKDVDNLCIDKKLVSWNKLKTLYIDSRYDAIVTNDIDEKATVKCVQMLGIKNFAINRHVNRLDNLLNCFIEMKVRLNKIKLMHKLDELEQIPFLFDTFLTKLLNGIKCNHWMKVNVVCELVYSSFISYKNINQLKDFNVAHFSYGSRKDDVYKHKTQFYESLLTQGTLNITKKL